jgi:hypothetical protein
LLAACAGTGNANPGATRNTPASSAQPSPTSALAFRCNLPISSDAFSNQQAGFVAIPSGAFTPDSSAALTYDTGTSRYRTAQSPALYGDSGTPSYDVALRRWLPVAWQQVLPDGSAYAYTREASPTRSRNEIHLVDVGSGRDRMIFNQDAYHVVAYQPEGVYVDYHLNGTDASSGLWLLNPTSGALKAYPTGRQGTWTRVAAGAAWSYSLNGSRFGSTSFARLDLLTGAVATWFSVTSPQPLGQPGSKSLRLIGLERDDPLVEVYSDEQNPEVWRLTAPNQATRLPEVPLGGMSPPASVTDSHGLWLIGSMGGVYLYSGVAADQVAAAPNANYVAAGACH